LLLEGGTHVSQAYEHYLQGKGYLSQYQDVQKNIDIAIEHFKTAAQLDNSFALV
jgi:hypothetical protein